MCEERFADNTEPTVSWQKNGNNLNAVRRKTVEPFRNKKGIGLTERQNEGT
jgi:hypothetical protein